MGDLTGRTPAVHSHHRRRGPAGDTKPALYYTVIAQWLVRLPVGYTLAFGLGYDIEGLWVSLIAFSGLQGWLTLRKFAQGKWKNRSL